MNILPVRLHETIVQQYARIEHLLESDDLLVKEKSSWSSYQHIEHILNVNAAIADMIEQQREPKDIRRRTVIGYLALAIGVLPRGKAKAPEAVLPKGLSKHALNELCQVTKERYLEIRRSCDVKEANSQHSKMVIGNHPYFGGLNSREWLRLAQIHTNHHLKIIEELP